jgi:hypothetical protein
MRKSLFRAFSAVTKSYNKHIAHVYPDDIYRGLCRAIWLLYSYIVTLYNQWNTDTISFQDMLVGSDQVS